MTDPAAASHRTLRETLTAALEDARPGLFDRLDDDLEAHLELVALARDAHAASGSILQAAVDSARSAGATWEQVGGVLGMTRQAAQQRFGRAGAPTEAPPAAPTDVRDTLVVRPLTALNEMRVLERAGRYGWHSVAFGAGYHVVERSGRQWEHSRSGPTFPGPGPGWERIGTSWGWWTYWKRPLDAAPLPGPVTVADLLRP